MTHTLAFYLVIGIALLLVIGILSAVAHLSLRAGVVDLTTAEQRKALNDTFANDPLNRRFPPMSQPAAKGFKRDGCIGIDQITRAERQRVLKLLAERELERALWTQPTKH